MYLSWRTTPAALTKAPLSNIRTLGLSERAGQNQSKWKHDLYVDFLSHTHIIYTHPRASLHMLEQEPGQDEQVRYISPKDL